MTTARRTPWTLLALLLPALWVAAPATAASAPLTGTMRLTAGACHGGAATGTYLRMVLPSGTAAGPFLSNNDSTCSDQSYTPLDPGTDGGLTSGGFQTTPTPAFDAKGNALARRITRPATFYGTGFATASNKVDPQTGKAVPVPTVTASGSTLTADLRSFAVTWNNQDFNQGSPKPDGSYPGNTRPATGTYDASTGAFTLTWTSQVVGGPFDKFTGLWHLQGTFVPTAAAAGGPRAGTTTTTIVPGSAGSAGGPAAAAPAQGRSPVTGAQAGAAPAAAAALPQAVPKTTTHTSTRTSWQASWWLIAIAVALALLGIGALVRIQRSLHREPEAA